MFEASRSLPVLDLPGKTQTLGTGSWAIKVVQHGSVAAKSFIEKILIHIYQK